MSTAQALSPDIEAKYEALVSAAFSAMSSMHHREVSEAAAAIYAYLGPDALATQRRAEYDALPDDQKRAMESKQDFGDYGVMHLATRPEVALTLRLCAQELSTGKNALNDIDRAALAKPGTVEAIATRFTDFTPERIAKILAL